MSRAAYMREYRAKLKAKREASLDDAADDLANNVDWPTARAMVETIRTLREEVARLKRELAARPAHDPFTQFRPVPKPTRK